VHSIGEQQTGNVAVPRGKDLTFTKWYSAVTTKKKNSGNKH